MIRRRFAMDSAAAIAADYPIPGRRWRPPVAARPCTHQTGRHHRRLHNFSRRPSSSFFLWIFRGRRQTGRSRRPRHPNPTTIRQMTIRPMMRSPCRENVCLRNEIKNAESVRNRKKVLCDDKKRLLLGPLDDKTFLMDGLDLFVQMKVILHKRK